MASAMHRCQCRLPFIDGVLSAGGPDIDSDTHNFIATDGDYYITIGDSIFWGQKDFFSGDGSTQDDSIVMLQGFQSNLADGLNDSTSSPDNNMVFKEAVPGDNSSYAAELETAGCARSPS